MAVNLLTLNAASNTIYAWRKRYDMTTTSTSVMTFANSTTQIIESIIVAWDNGSFNSTPSASDHFSVRLNSPSGNRYLAFQQKLFKFDSVQLVYKGAPIYVGNGEITSISALASSSNYRMFINGLKIT